MKLVKKFQHSGTITQDNTRVAQPVYIPTLEDLQLAQQPHYVTRVQPVITASKPKAQIEGERRIGARTETNKKEEFERNKQLMADALTFGMTPHRNDVAAQVGASDMANQVMYTLLGEGAIKAAPYITYGLLGKTNLGKALYLNNGLRNPIINTTVGQNPLHNLSIYPNEEAVNWIYANHPELASVGTKEQYLEYLRSIFPKTQSKQVVWHGSNADLTKGFNSAKRVTGSGSPEAASRQDMFFNGRPADSYQYVEGINAPDNKQWGKHFYWYAKEILGKPNYYQQQWRNLPWEQTIREEIPNKKGQFTRKFNEVTGNFEGYGKFLKEYKKELGAENLTDSEFFTNVLGFKPGESFNQWVSRNKEAFEQVQSQYEGKGMYPALVDARHPYVESPLLDTEYRDRGTFVKMKQNGNDVLYGPFTDNEFGSDVTLVVDGGGSNKNKIHWLGTPEDINTFKDYTNSIPEITPQQAQLKGIGQNVSKPNTLQTQIITSPAQTQQIPFILGLKNKISSIFGRNDGLLYNNLVNTDWYNNAVQLLGKEQADDLVQFLESQQGNDFVLQGLSSKQALKEYDRYNKVKNIIDLMPASSELGGSAALSAQGTLQRPTIGFHDLDFNYFVPGLNSLYALEYKTLHKQVPGLAQFLPNNFLFRKMYPVQGTVPQDPITRRIAFTKYGIPVDVFLKTEAPTPSIITAPNTLLTKPETILRAKQYWTERFPNAARVAKDVKDLKNYKAYGPDNPVFNLNTGESQFSPILFDNRVTNEKGIPNIGFIETYPGSGVKVPVIMNWKGEYKQVGNPIISRKKGGKAHIYIKPENRGKFTALKKRTGKSATWFKEHGTPAQKKMAIFALNSRKWKH